VLVAYVWQWDPMGYIFEAGNCSTALSFIRDVDFLDVIFLDQDEGCPAFDELFCVVGELKSRARVVVISVDSGAAQAAGDCGVAFCKSLFPAEVFR